MHTIDTQPTSDHSTVFSMNIYQTETYQFARRRFTRLVMRMDLHLRSQTSWRFWNHYTMDVIR